MKKFVSSLLTACVLVTGSVSVAYAGHHENKEEHAHEIGMSVGQAIPAENGVSLALKNEMAEDVSFQDLKGENGVVVAFVRSADWCPFCKKQLVDLEKIASQLSEQGYPLVSISYDAPEKLAAFKAKRKLSYTLASDTASANIKAFGLLNEKYEMGSKAYGIPHPAIYIIGNDGIVKAKLMEEGFKKRPASDLVLETVLAVSK